MPVLVRPTDLSRTALAGRVSLPRTGKSVLMPDNDEAWVAIVKELDELLRIPPRAVPAPAALSSLRLSGKQTGQLRNLLVALFPTFKDLEMMVLIELDERLASITAEKGTAEVAFNLITWAEARGRFQDLLAGALARRPGSEELKAFVSALGAARG